MPVSGYPLLPRADTALSDLEADAAITCYARPVRGMRNGLRRRRSNPGDSRCGRIGAFRSHRCPRLPCCPRLSPGAGDVDPRPTLGIPRARNLERNVRQTTASRATRAHRLFVALILAVAIPPLSAQSRFDEDTQRLLVDAVEAAATLDLYNGRCRNDVSGRSTDNLNKMLVGKFRMTVLDVQDDLFPERSYRQAGERLQRDFFIKLKEIGGCKEAKSSGMPDQLRTRYDDLMRALDRLP